MLDPLIGYDQGDGSQLRKSFPEWYNNGFAYGATITPPVGGLMASAPTGDAYGNAASGPLPTAPPPAPAPVMPAQTYGGFNGPENGNSGNAPGSEATGSLLGDARGMYNGLSDVAKAGVASIGNSLSDLIGSGNNGQMADFSGTNMNASGGTDSPSRGGADEGGPGNGGKAGLFKGGIVRANNLSGPKPDSPDDGYTAMERGEGVLTDAAIKHYGKGIVARLNKLQVSKDALR
jgi:hypothetical protein